MYALIYDGHRFERPQKKVISVHETREDTEMVLEKRKEELGKKVWECHTRIIWTEKDIRSGDLAGPFEYDAWRPGEEIPVGEVYGDSD